MNGGDSGHVINARLLKDRHPVSGLCSMTESEEHRLLCRKGWSGEGGECKTQLEDVPWSG